MFRRAAPIAIAASVFLVMTGCGGEDAGALAAKACEASPPSSANPDPGNADFTVDDMKKLIDDTNTAADYAAQAAAADSNWRALSVAYSSTVDELQQLEPFVRLPASSFQDGQGDQVVSVLKEMLAVQKTLRAQCRIAQAAK